MVYLIIYRDNPMFATSDQDKAKKKLVEMRRQDEYDSFYWRMIEVKEIDE